MNSDFLDIIIIFIVLAVVLLPFIIKIIKGGDRKRREEKILQYAKRTKATVRPYFGKFFKDCGDMECFLDMLSPSFCNVIEKLDKENGDIFIGELRWEISVRRNRRRRRSVLFDNSEDNYVRVPKDATLCVLYDDGFNLPNFDLIRETFKDKATEVLGMNKTEDIDFDDDKEFSGAWWLSSSENMIVKELFTKNIRTNFMSFVDKGYRICGRRNVIFIITSTPLWPENYPKLISDIRLIQRFMKNNKKFYTPNSENKPENN